MHLIGLEHHEIFVFEFNDHCDMVKVTVGQKPLKLGTEVFGIKKQYVSCFSFFQELLFCQDVFMLVKKFALSLQHQLISLPLIVYHCF